MLLRSAANSRAPPRRCCVLTPAPPRRQWQQCGWLRQQAARSGWLLPPRAFPRSTPLPPPAAGVPPLDACPRHRRSHVVLQGQHVQLLPRGPRPGQEAEEHPDREPGQARAARGGGGGPGARRAAGCPWGCTAATRTSPLGPTTDSSWEHTRAAAGAVQRRLPQCAAGGAATLRGGSVRATHWSRRRRPCCRVCPTTPWTACWCTDAP